MNTIVEVEHAGVKSMTALLTTINLFRNVQVGHYRIAGNFGRRKRWRIVKHSPKCAFSVAVVYVSQALDAKIKFAKT